MAGSPDDLLRPPHSPASRAIVSAWTPHRFFDAASGLPPSERCVQWLDSAWSSVWADPVGRHAWSARSSAALSQARGALADFIGCSPAEIWFAANPDSAISTMIAAMSEALRSADNPMLFVSQVERLSALRTCDALGTGLAVQELAVDSGGRVAVAALREGFGNPRLVVVQAANREIGTVQDLDAIADAAGLGGTLLVDATALRRRSDMPTRWDALVLDPSMWGGPSGLAIVACRTGAPWTSAVPATTDDRFPGRPPVPLIATAAMTLPDSGAEEDERRIATMARRFADRIESDVPMSVVLGSREHRLAHIVALSMLYVNADQLLDDLSRLGFAVASGSACTSDTRRPSHVLTAIGALSHGNLRVSLPPGCPEEDLDELAAAITELVHLQRAEAGVL